ncbi:hypothetical protein NDU88_005175 [Pleurodeles waltl]|uniref:Myb/SANT-like DNA-binding domain-containing protein n=1 Tax=Pleurodeles waltl TaxID=8319 RepID=A0AAV7UIT6_PLEWA|nr:hypothetical protein NDU88_005175 [Pleurodeles waltl]
MQPSPHMSQRTVPMKDNSEHRVKQLRGEDLHCKCCCDLGLEETTARVSGKRAPAFTSQELEKLVDGVLPQYTLLYSPPDKQVSAHQKKDIWRAIAKDVRTLGVYHRQSTLCRKRWEDIRHWSKKTTEAQLGMASQPSSGGGAVAPEHKGAASHMALEGDTTESEFTSGTECEGSSTAGTGADTSDTDSSSDGSSLVVAATSVPPASTARPSHRSRTSTSATTSPGPVVPVVTGIWSAPATRAASVARSHSTDSPPPVKHQKLASARRERGKTPATKAAPRGPVGSVESAVTPSKVGKGHKKPGKSGKSSTAEKTAIIPAAQEATARTSPVAQEPTASTSPAAQEPTAISSPAAQEPTASTSPAAQEPTASTSPAAQEPTAITSPAAQEATASCSPAAQEATASSSPAAQEDEALWAPCPLQNQWRLSSTTSVLNRMKHSGHHAPSRTSGDCHPLVRLWLCTPQDGTVGNPPTV